MKQNANKNRECVIGPHMATVGTNKCYYISEKYKIRINDFWNVRLRLKLYKKV
jgi:hypothetical protein